MILSRAKPAIARSGIDGGDNDRGAPASGGASKQLPKLEDFLARRDYIGAMCLLGKW